MPAKTTLTIHSIFPLGRIVYTRGAIASCTPFQLIRSLLRHASGDWGCVDRVSKAVNDAAVVMGLQVCSVYAIDPSKPCAGSNALWVVTEYDRRSTIMWNQ